MPNKLMSSIPASIEQTQALLEQGNYVADRSLATTLFLALRMQRPLFLEGEAGASIFNFPFTTGKVLSVESLGEWENECLPVTKKLI